MLGQVVAEDGGDRDLAPAGAGLEAASWVRSAGSPTPGSTRITPAAKSTSSTRRARSSPSRRPPYIAVAQMARSRSGTAAIRTSASSGAAVAPGARGIRRDAAASASPRATCGGGSSPHRRERPSTSGISAKTIASCPGSRSAMTRLPTVQRGVRGGAPGSYSSRTPEYQRRVPARRWRRRTRHDRRSPHLNGGQGRVRSACSGVSRRTAKGLPRLPWRGRYCAGDVGGERGDRPVACLTALRQSTTTGTPVLHLEDRSLRSSTLRRRSKGVTRRGRDEATEAGADSSGRFWPTFESRQRSSSTAGDQVVALGRLPRPCRGSGIARIEEPAAWLAVVPRWQDRHGSEIGFSESKLEKPSKPPGCRSRRCRRRTSRSFAGLYDAVTAATSRRFWRFATRTSSGIDPRHRRASDRRALSRASRRSARLVSSVVSEQFERLRFEIG